eukprot:CAMPEP_0174350854 /NCGR_PEP_ID=MMETSP0811_2-20130205/8029_1 /TAXON_ID=73025 ORGANISM="Eutreptiella gymnastica-like, Strain CCMP1594" /NCGR_SAMPLE_ID=MMETSP0811_2 /ASSEMBLY_ACC=CAM_ASM_000667 /LENGTH=109 /DNA_ID=CAMNT_0015479537 /DNA_START=747 /DNA_END=1076 /DNA_ORIENTATION=+
MAAFRVLLGWLQGWAGIHTSGRQIHPPQKLSESKCLLTPVYCRCGKDNDHCTVTFLTRPNGTPMGTSHDDMLPGSSRSSGHPPNPSNLASQLGCCGGSKARNYCSNMPH